MLLVALYYEPQNAVPMIIHIWYSALLPAAMLQSLQSDILPLIDQTCSEGQGKAPTSVHAKTITIRGKHLCLKLKIEEWSRLLAYFHVPEGLTVARAQEIRHSVTLASGRVDSRVQAMLHQPPALRQAAMKFRDTGVLLPFGSSTAAFNTPNP